MGGENVWNHPAYAAASHQSKLGWTWSRESDILSTPPLIFTGSDKAWNVALLFHQSRIWRALVWKLSNISEY